MLVSKNVEMSRKKGVGEVLGVRISEGHGKYLGVPVVVGQSKRDVFNNIRDRIWKR